MKIYVPFKIIFIDYPQSYHQIFGQSYGLPNFFAHIYKNNRKNIWRI